MADMKEIFNHFRGIIRSGILMTAMFAIGVVGFSITQGLSLIDAAYMAAITMSTVGYEIPGEISLTPEGKIFTIAYIVLSIGTFFYVLTAFTSFIIEGEFRKLYKGYQVKREISAMKGHIVVCGLGRNGKEAVRELQRKGEKFVVIERDQKLIEAFLESNPGIRVLQGDATHEELLRDANVAQAKGVITTLAEDADNVFVTLSVRELNPDLVVVARASSQNTISKLRRAGADRVIIPNQLGGRKMAKIMTEPALVDFVDMITGQGQFHLSLREIDVNPDDGLEGKTLRDLDIRSKSGCLVLGMRGADGHFELNPSPTRTIEVGEKIFLLGSTKQLQSFTEQFG